jgi:2-keto-4-pentenoate hydratase
LLGARGELLAGGASAVGWKVGFGAPASLELMHISAPLLGFLSDRTKLSSGATVDASTWARGVVEFEVAVYMGSDLGAFATEVEARSAVSAIGPAIELANINLPVGPRSVTDIVGANIFHEGFVLGTPDPGRASINLDGLTARVVVDSVPWAQTSDLQALTGTYSGIVATVATTLESQGQRLRAGEVIITGSVIPPIDVAEGSNFEFILDPFESISVEIES